MGNSQPHPDSVIDVTSDTIVLAFDLLDAQIARMPQELARALQSAPVQQAIESALMRFAKSRQNSGTTVVSQKEASDFATALLTKTGQAVEQDLADQVKRTSEYRNLEASVEHLEKSLASSPLGVWVDEHRGILYVIGAGMAIGGATALYITKTGGPMVKYPIGVLAGRDVPVFTIGKLSLSGQLLAFQPETRTIGASLTGTQKFERLSISLQLGIIATDTTVQKVSGQVVLKTPDINVGVTGSAQPTTRSGSLSLSIELTNSALPGPLNVAVGVGFKDGKANAGSLNAGMQTKYGTFGATGSAGKSDLTGRDETKILGTWSLSL